VTHEDDLRALADERALRQLITRYAQGADRRDGSLFSGVFAPHAVLEGTGFKFTTPEEISGVPFQLKKMYTKTYHTLLNYAVEVSGDRANGEVYSMAHHLTPIDADHYSDYVMYITYRDRYVRAATEWQIEYRQVVVEFTEYRVAENVSEPPTP
jgi:hypothetical protein